METKCTNAHDRCYGGAGGPCEYCERMPVSYETRVLKNGRDPLLVLRERVDTEVVCISAIRTTSAEGEESIVITTGVDGRDRFTLTVAEWNDFLKKANML